MKNTVKMTTRGRVTLPKKTRDNLGWAGGDKVEWEIIDNQTIIARRVIASASVDTAISK
jgi:AbrB family looped-hinge helix DNA binding protein